MPLPNVADIYRHCRTSAVPPAPLANVIDVERRCATNVAYHFCLYRGILTTTASRTRCALAATRCNFFSRRLRRCSAVRRMALFPPRCGVPSLVCWRFNTPHISGAAACLRLQVNAWCVVLLGNSGSASCCGTLANRWRGGRRYIVLCNSASLPYVVSCAVLLP